jgi:hypothetical protein
MKTLITLATMLGATVLAATPAQAQGFRGGTGARYLLLANKSVQRELKLSNVQADRVTRIVEEVGSRTRQKLEDIPDDQRRTKAPAILRAASDEVRTAAKAVLRAEQLSRFDQIVRQSQGVQAFLDPTVQERLRLTDEQKSSFRELADSVRTEMGELRRGLLEDRDGTARKMAAVRTTALEKGVGLLNDGQKSTWRDMIGMPFEIRYERRFR